MRFRLIRRGTAAAPPKASDLDNPYGRYYGTARKREDLRK